MLNLLRKQIQRWLDYVDDIEEYKKSPTRVMTYTLCNYRQATAAVESDPLIYSALSTYIQKKDAKNNFKLLRLAVEKDPKFIAYFHAPEMLPADLLCIGLESEYIWKMILDNWGAYDNAEFYHKFPIEAASLDFYKDLDLPAHDCAYYFRVRKNAKNVPDSPQTELVLPDF